MKTIFITRTSLRQNFNVLTCFVLELLGLKFRSKLMWFLRMVYAQGFAQRLKVLETWQVNFSLNIKFVSIPSVLKVPKNVQCCLGRW